MHPAVLLADEPTGNLDQATGREVMNLLEQLVAQHVALVVVTHDPVIGSRASRQIHMVDGRIISENKAPAGASDSTTDTRQANA